MPLNKTGIVHYLLSRGLLPPHSIVDGDVVVLERQSRHQSFSVLRTHESPSYFLKQAHPLRPDTGITLQREANCYRLAQRDGALPRLADLQPRFFEYDAARQLLVTEHLTDFVDLAAFYYAHKKYPPQIGAQLGKALGAYHREGTSLPGDARSTTVFPRSLPPALQFHEMQMQQQMTQASGSLAHLAQIVRQYPMFGQALGELQQMWRTCQPTLIHGDMKWQNCLVWCPDFKDAEVRVIDWELADIGDPRWDVGGFIQSYFTGWIMSMPTSPMDDPNAMVAMAGISLTDLLPTLEAFWHAYTESLGVSPSESLPLLEQCMKYGAARMLQTAYELSAFQPQISPYAVRTAQVSLNILTDVRAALTHLLGK